MHTRTLLDKELGKVVFCRRVFIMDQQQLARIFSIENFLNAPYSEEPLGFDAQGKETTNHELGLVQLARMFSIENFLNAPYSEEPLDFDAQGKEITNHELGLVQIRNYEELAFDASILDIEFEGCTPEDYHELPTYAHSNMENDKQEGTSTLTKQNLVDDSPVTYELPKVLSPEERRRQYNRESARRSRAKMQAHVNELEAMEKVFNEVKPLLRNILIADSGSLTYAATLLRKQLKDLIVKNQNAAIALGFNHTGPIVGAKMGQSPSLVRVGSCERLHKKQPVM